MRKIALWGPAILIGVWGATLSSALGSILGAPRILQALARDGILPRFMRIVGRGSGARDEPRIGTYVSMALALGVVAVGDLNAVAPVLTMFFLATYAVINLVSAGERFLRNPSFRPTFRVHWTLSLAGAVGCAAVMFLIDPIATIIALAVVAGLWGLLNRRKGRARWGDIRQGLWLALIKWSATHVRPYSHAKSWRPNILVLAGSPTKRWYLIDLAHSLAQDRGLLTIATILPEPTPSERKRHLTETVRAHLAAREVDALVRVVSAPSPYDGAAVLVEAYGLGSVVPNTVVLGDGGNAVDPDKYATMLRRFHEAGRNVITVRADDDTTFDQRQRIDIWLSSIRDNGALMMTLAHTLRSSKKWKKPTVTIHMIVRHDDAAREVTSNLTAMLTAARLVADVDVIVDDEPVGAVISKRAGASDLVLIGLPDPCAHPDDFPQRLSALMNAVQIQTPTAFVLASTDIDLESLLD
jgi:hypothetical protein